MPSPRAVATLRFFEYAAKPPLPSLATLARFRKQLSASVTVNLVAPKITWLTPKGPMRPSAELDAGAEWVRRAADILGVECIVFATGAELTTGDRDRSLFAAYLERFKSTGRKLVVAPRGLWEAEHGVAFAEATGTIYGFDPLEDDAPVGSVLYARVRPMGVRSRLTEGHLAQIAERLLLPETEVAYLSIESDEALRDARRLATLLSQVTREDFLAAREEGLPLDDDDDEEADDEELASGDGEADDEELASDDGDEVPDDESDEQPDSLEEDDDEEADDELEDED